MPGTNAVASAQMRGMNSYSFLVLLVSVLGGMLFGLDSGSTGPVTEMDGFRSQIGWPLASPKQYPQCGPGAYQDPSSITAKQGHIAGIFHFGAMLGAPVGGLMSDRYGRRPTIFIACVLFNAGALWQALSGVVQPDCGTCLYRDMLLGRMLGGLGLGFMLTNVPVYVSELAPPRLRGAVGSAFQVSVNFGILLCSIINMEASQYWNGWRFTLAAQAVPATIVAIACVTVLPESPRFFARCGEDKKAMDVLVRLNGNSPQKEAIAASELEDIRAEVLDIQAAGSLSWREMLRGSDLTSLLTGVVVLATQNITGICYFINFAPNIVSNLCLSPWLGSIAINIVNFAASVGAMILVDRFGRKTLLLWGTYFMCAAFLVNSILFTVVPNLLDDKAVGTLILVFICLFMAAFGLSWGPMGWLIPSEIMPLSMRGKGMGLAVTANMISSILFGDYGPNFLSSPDVLGIVGTWWVLAAINFFWVLPVVVFLVPETRSLTLEEMSNAFSYKFGGNEEGKRTMQEFFQKNAGQARDISRCRSADMHAGFEAPSKTQTA